MDGFATLAMTESRGGIGGLMYQQIYDPVAGSLGWTSIFAAVPLTLMFVMLGVFKRSPQLSALVSLIACLAVAVLIYPVPFKVALNSGLYGVAFAMMTIGWILINAMWVYNITVKTGHFTILRESFGHISSDLRVQGIIIAFCFGALIEAIAGSGVPIAICSAMLVAIGFDPVKAAVMALVADTAPVAFGALAVPITVLNAQTDLPYNVLGAMVGRQCPFIAAILPFILVFIVDGARGLRMAWPAALVGGVSFGLVQYLVSNFLAVQITDVLAALASAGAIVALSRVWRPAEVLAVPGAGSGPAASRREMLLAYAPYIFIVIIFSLAQVPPIAHLLSYGVYKFPWPGLALTQADGSKINTTFTVNYLPVAGTLLLFSGLLTMIALRVTPALALRAFGAALVQVRWALPTIFMILAIAYIMNWSGQTTTLGRFLAGAGTAYALLSPVIGWIGVVVTGSDASTNALFGHLQVVAAKATGISPVLLAAANTTGGVLGKMLSPQSLAIGAAAVGLIGREGDIFRGAFGWGVALLAGLCVFVYLQSTPILGWMVP
jgi:lactate permease